MCKEAGAGASVLLAFLLYMLPLAILPVVAAQSALRDRSRTWTALLWATTLLGAAVGTAIGSTTQPDPHGSLSAAYATWAARLAPAFLGILVVTTTAARKAPRWRAWAHAASLVDLTIYGGILVIPFVAKACP